MGERMIEVSIGLIVCLFGLGIVVMSQPEEEDTHVDVADLPRSSLDELLGE